MKVPFKRTLSILVAAVATNADAVTILGKAPFAGSVSAVGFVPNAAITGQNTNTRRIAIENRGDDGLGSTEMAALQFNSGVNGVAFDEKAVTLSAVANAVDFVAGDVLVVNSTSPGSGLADPGGLYIVELTRSDD